MSQSDLDWFWTGLRDYLLAKKLKQTQQRVQIIEGFLTAGQHISAEGLHGKLRSMGQNVGLATVYRTLNLLKEAGLVEQRTFAEGKSEYELAGPDSHHDHLICRDCGHVEEFENDSIEKLQVEIAEKLGFSLVDHKLELFGQCLRTECPYRDAPAG